MNIHFTDKYTYDKLKESTIVSIVVGSKMYGLDNNKSDIDYLHIYATSDLELNNPFIVNHQLQYKDDGVDHNFVSLHTFIRNICNGDSTINFEVIHSDEIKNSDISFLYEFKDAFYSYNVIKSYIGLIRRDYKFYGKGDKKENKIKKLKHIIRGFIFVNSIIDGKFSLFNQILIDTCNGLYEMNSTELDEAAEKYNTLNEKLRIDINSRISDFPRYMHPDKQYMLNKTLLYYCSGEAYNKIKLKGADAIINLYHNSFENWVVY